MPFLTGATEQAAPQRREGAASVYLEVWETQDLIAERRSAITGT